MKSLEDISFLFVFDFDDTLVDKTEADVHSFIDILQNYVEIQKDSIFTLRKTGLTAIQIIERQISDSILAMKLIRERKIFLNSKEYYSLIQPHKFIFEFLGYIQSLNSCIVLCSFNMNSSLIQSRLKELDLLKYFKFLIFREKKEEKDPFEFKKRKFLEIKNKFQESICFSIGDSEADFKAAIEQNFIPLTIHNDYQKFTITRGFFRESFTNYSNMKLNLVNFINSLNENWILVTGASGLVGLEIAEFLLKKKKNVIGLRKGSEKPSVLAKFTNYYQISCDLGDGELINLSIPFKIRTVIHCAAYIPHNWSSIDSTEVYRVNVLGTLELLQKFQNISTFVLASTISVYKGNNGPFLEQSPIEPTNTYSFSKLLSELIVLNDYFKIPNKLILRFPSVIGKNQRNYGIVKKFIDDIRKENKITVIGEGEATRDFLYSKNIPPIILKLLEKEINGIYNIGSGTETKISELAYILRSITGCEMIFNETKSEDRSRYVLSLKKLSDKIDIEKQPSLEDNLRDLLKGD